MRILTTFSFAFVNLIASHCQPLPACVEYDRSTGDYSVDKSGCIKDAFEEHFIDEKMYIDEDEMSSTYEAFYVHLGNNVWIKTKSVSRDCKGLFTYRSSIDREVKEKSNNYEKKWKCPYCYMYWTLGTACQNKDCPSKY